MPVMVMMTDYHDWFDYNNKHVHDSSDYGRDNHDNLMVMEMMMMTVMMMMMIVMILIVMMVMMIIDIMIMI